MRNIRWWTAVLSGLILASCSTSVQSVDSTVASTSLPPVPSANPWNELEDLAAELSVVDYSRLSINHDGIFAVMIRDKVRGDVATVGTFTFWRWDGKLWNDVSNSVVNRPLEPKFFERKSKYGASRVTSYDYNEDGVVDFLVNFNEAELGLNHEIGGILSNRSGVWQWESIMFLDGSIGQAGFSLSFYPDSDHLTIRDYPPESMAMDLDLLWDRDRKMFVVQDGFSYGD